MQLHLNKPAKSKRQSTANSSFSKRSENHHALKFADNRPETRLQRKLQEMANNSLQTKQATQMHASISPLPAVSFTKGTIQRRIKVGGKVYKANSKSSQAVKEATKDEFTRYYESEQEVKDHLDNKKPVPFGLIKERALWYRMPYLSQNFFVFGESHAAVRGARIKEESNIQKPILDESKPGWTVGKDDTSGGDVGADENSSKLLRALEFWDPEAFEKKSSGATPSPSIPKIPTRRSSTRETERGTHRLVVYGKSGEAEYWKPSGHQQAPQSTHDFENEVLSGIESLFSVVFENEIRDGSLDKKYGDKTSLAWEYFIKKIWSGTPNPLTIQKNIKKFLMEAAQKKVSEEYGKLQIAKSDVTKKEDKSTWTADDYRNEFMLVNILKANTGSIAFATIGDAHLKALKERLDRKKIHTVSREEFFSTYSRKAVDTQKIAHGNSPIYRKYERLRLWSKGALEKYPGKKRSDIEKLTPKDMGEFVKDGIISKWKGEGAKELDGEFNKRVRGQFLKDLKMIYPDGDHDLSRLTPAQIGEFLSEEKISS